MCSVEKLDYLDMDNGSYTNKMIAPCGDATSVQEQTWEASWNDWSLGDPQPPAAFEVHRRDMVQLLLPLARIGKKRLVGLEHQHTEVH